MSAFWFLYRLAEVNLARHPRINILAARGLRVLLILVLLCAALSEGSMQAHSAYAAPTANCHLAWSVVSGAINENYMSNILNDVSAISTDDAWAVGDSWGGVAPTAGLIEHWDGTKWKFVAGPHLREDQNKLLAVAAVDSNHAWAAGYSYNFGIDQQIKSWLLNWDGSAWSQVASPNPGTTDNFVKALGVVSENDVWAVGTQRSGSSESDYSTTLIMHWDGTSWNVVPSPNISDAYNGLTAISVIAANDIWAVGGYSNSAPDFAHTLVIHYDGNSWQIVSSPNPSNESGLNSVAAVSTNTVWASGTSEDENYVTHTFILNWDGTTWNIQDTFSDTSNGGTAMTAISSDDAWFVATDVSGSVVLPLIERWQGSEWRQVNSPIPNHPSNFPSALSAASRSDIWMVGRSYDGGQYRQDSPFIEHYGPPIPKPKLISPDKGATVTTRKVPLDWNDADCATRYEVVVNQDSKQGTTVDSQTNLTISQYTTIALTRGKTYYWHVRGCDADGCGFWSKWRSFTISPSVARFEGTPR